MKLPKDKFKRSDIDEMKNKIAELLDNFVQNNLLVCHFSKNNPKTLYLGNQNTVNLQYYNVISSTKDLVKNHLKKFPNEIGFSNVLYIHYPLCLDFYYQTFLKLSEKDKPLFLKLIRPTKLDIQSLETSLAVGRITESDYWIHFRHVEPFDNPSRSVDDVRQTLDFLDKKQFDSEEKTLALAYYVRYNKPIFKRTDIQSGFIRFIKKNVDEKYFPIFENLLKIDLKNANKNDGIFVEAGQIQHLNISKEKIFNNLPLQQIKQATIDEYNSYLRVLHNFLLSDEVKDKLNLERIDFCEFVGGNSPARVYFQSNKKGFDESLEPIYNHLLCSCSHQYSKGLNNGLDSAFKSAMQHFFLTRELNPDTTDTERVSKPRNLKI